MNIEIFSFLGTSFKHNIFELIRKDMPREAEAILSEVVDGANEIARGQYTVTYNRTNGKFIVVRLSNNFSENQLEALLCEIQSELDEMTEGYYE